MNLYFRPLYFSYWLIIYTLCYVLHFFMTDNQFAPHNIGCSRRYYLIEVERDGERYVFPDVSGLKGIILESCGNLFGNKGKEGIGRNLSVFEADGLYILDIPEEESLILRNSLTLIDGVEVKSSSSFLQSIINDSRLHYRCLLD